MVADGLRIAYVLAGCSAGDSIRILDVDGGNERPLVRPKESFTSTGRRGRPTVRYIYFIHSMTAWNAAPMEVYRVAATGGPPELVVASASRAVFAAATPDGRGLIYAADPAGRS